MVSASATLSSDDDLALPPATGTTTVVARAVAWAVVATMAVYVWSTYMIYWWDWPSMVDLGHDLGIVAGKAPANFNSGLAWLQAGVYVAAALGALGFAQMTSARPLRADSGSLYALSAYLVRATYWAVLLVGLADMIISFLRVEDLLKGLVGDAMASSLGRAQFRGLYVHTPLLVVSLVIAYVTRSLGFVWLGLLVLLAEFQIVITRFVFSYEQAFMGDLVRFWYAALFLISSPYTLIEEGHVRVDVLYAGFSRRTKAVVNMFGSLILGVIFCWVVLALGTWTKSSVIVGPLLTFEVSQSGFGMYIKYLMAGLLGIFAITMMVQFVGYFLHSLANYRGDPGERLPDSDTTQ